MIELKSRYLGKSRFVQDKMQFSSQNCPVCNFKETRLLRIDQAIWACPPPYHGSNVITRQFYEVPAFIKACDLCVAPIFSGSGTRLKILEYMPTRKPVVATAKGAEGLKVEDGKSILLAETAVAFSNNLIILLQDTQLRTRLGEKGFLVVKAFYSWPSILQQFCQKLSPADGENQDQRVA